MSEPFLHGPLGTPFVELDTVGSTNNYALSQLHAGLAQHGTTFFAHEQTAGKGQRGKTWLTGQKVNILMSIVIDPSPLSLAQQFQLSACVAVAAADVFAKYAGDQTKIKWPNDLYWGDRKAGGILIENIIGKRYREVEAGRVESGNEAMESTGNSAHWRWAVAGMGININQASFPEDLRNPVSLLQITGKRFDPIALAREICDLASQNLKNLLINGFEPLHTRYISLLYKRNETVKFKKGSRLFEATVVSVLPDGQLLVKHAVEEELPFGSVEWISSDLAKKM